MFNIAINLGNIALEAVTAFVTSQAFTTANDLGRGAADVVSSLIP